MNVSDLITPARVVVDFRAADKSGHRMHFTGFWCSILLSWGDGSRLSAWSCSVRRARRNPQAGPLYFL